MTQHLKLRPSHERERSSAGRGTGDPEADAIAATGRKLKRRLQLPDGSWETPAEYRKRVHDRDVEIKRLWESGEARGYEIAERFGVTKQRISEIVNEEGFRRRSRICFLCEKPFEPSCPKTFRCKVCVRKRCTRLILTNALARHSKRMLALMKELEAKDLLKNTASHSAAIRSVIYYGELIVHYSEDLGYPHETRRQPFGTTGATKQ